jgi:mono/diheme cytochrome c family protein
MIDKKEEDTSSKETLTGKSTAESPGKELFYMKSSVNNIACADCHSDGTNDANPLTKYFSNIQGADKRTSTYHGKFTGEEVLKNAGGATICWESYEKNKTPLTTEQINALNDYYASVAKDNSPGEMQYETIALPTRDRTKLKSVQNAVLELKGDPEKGEKNFENACAFCHGDNATVKKVPRIFDDFEGNVKSIVYNVKLGDGSMPFFHSPAMSDQELADIAAYIMKRNGK